VHAYLRLALVAGLSIAGTTGAADSAFVFVNDVVTVEAERLPRSANWRLESSVPGYTGTGYVRYVGPRQGPTYVRNNDQLVTENDDVNGIYQGNPADWLVVPVLITTAGSYNVNLRTTHDHTCYEPHCLFDGDVTVWTHVVGLGGTVKFSHGCCGEHSFAWMPYGPGSAFTELTVPAVTFTVSSTAAIKPGLVEFYIAGRDVGFRIDRISIYRKTGPNQYPASHCSNTAPQSAMTAVTSVAYGERVPPPVGRELLA
jgi:hypothetical protein